MCVCAVLCCAHAVSGWPLGHRMQGSVATIMSDSHRTSEGGVGGDYVSYHDSVGPSTILLGITVACSPSEIHVHVHVHGVLT